MKVRELMLRLSEYDGDQDVMVGGVVGDRIIWSTITEVDDYAPQVVRNVGNQAGSSGPDSYLGVWICVG